MNKIFLAGLVISGLMVISSCKKEYTCECTSTFGGFSSSASSTVKATKKKAEAGCISKETINGTTTICAIK